MVETVARWRRRSGGQDRVRTGARCRTLRSSEGGGLFQWPRPVVRAVCRRRPSRDYLPAFPGHAVRKNTAAGVVSSGCFEGQRAAAAVAFGGCRRRHQLFTVMSHLAAESGDQSVTGDSDFDCDPALIDAVVRHMRAGLNQYRRAGPLVSRAIGAVSRSHPPPTTRNRGHESPRGTERSSTRSRRWSSRRRGRHSRTLLRLVRAVGRTERRRADRGPRCVAGLPQSIGTVCGGGHPRTPC